jgi:ABC-type transporter Mla subunit MlaD
MKTVLSLIGAATLVAGSVFAGPDVIIKQRAKEIRDQNNVRQGVTTPGQATPPSQPSASTAPSPLLQQNLAKVRADLATFKPNSPVTPQQKLQFKNDLLASAQGASKPSPATISALADSLSAAFTQSAFPDKDRDRLVSRLAAVLNPANIQSSQMQAIYADVQAIFQANGMARKDAVKIVDQVKAVGAETQKSGG